MIELMMMGRKNAQQREVFAAQMNPFRTYQFYKDGSDSLASGVIYNPGVTLYGFSVDFEGNSYFVQRGSDFRKYSPDGDLLLTVDSLGSNEAYTFPTPDGGLLIASSTNVVKYDASGNDLWTYALSGIGTTPNGFYVHLNGDVVFVTSSRTLVRLTSLGALLWEVDIPELLSNTSFSDICVDESGNTYLTDRRQIFKVSPSGSLLFTQSRRNTSSSSICLGDDGFLYKAGVESGNPFIDKHNVSTGAFVSTLYTDPGGGFSASLGMKVDTEFNIYALFSFPGSTNRYLAKIDRLTGSVLWSAFRNATALALTDGYYGSNYWKGNL